MNRNSQTVVLLVLVVACFSPVTTRAQQVVRTKGVLVLDWYNKDYPWNVRFDQSFREALQTTAGNTVEYYPEYLESNRFPGEDQSLLLRDYLKQKYANHRVDVIVANSDASLNFLLKHRATLFTSTPIVFIAVRRPAADEVNAGAGLTGIININTQKETLDLALNLHPDTNQVFVISGTIERDKRFEMLARNELQTYETRVQITYLTDLQPAELIATLKNLPRHSIVLYLWQQSVAENGRRLETSDIFNQIAPSATVPIYGLSTPYIGSGAVGGVVTTAETIATRAAEMALRIVNGERAQNIPVEMAPAVPMFDWRQLQQRNISEAQLPSGTILLFKELSLWEQHNGAILSALILIVGQTALIGWLLAERRSRRKAVEARRHLAAIVESSTDAIIGTTLDGKILSWNEGAKSLYGYTDDEVMGRNISLVVPPERREEFAESLKRRSRGERIDIFETVRLKKDGTRIDVAISVSPIKDDRGRVIADATITRDVSARKHAEKELRYLTGRLIHLQDEERRRIAGELHDSLGQSLVIIKNRAMICLRDPTSFERVTEQLEEISSTATSAIDEVHEIAHNLRPYELDRLGLVRAVETMISKLANSSSIELIADLDPIDGLLSREAETSVYRIIQEGVNNVVKHAEATKGRVSVKRTSDQLVIVVSDNGKGITEHQNKDGNKNGLGLAGVAERARMLGGSSAVESAPQSGTRMIVTVPLPEAPPHVV